MGLDLLDSPLRITWDLCPTGQEWLSEEQLLLIAERLTDAGLFFLLLDQRPLLHPGLSAVLSQLSGAGCQVSLVTEASAEERAALAKLPTPPEILVDAAPWLANKEGLAGLEGEISALMQLGHRVSLLWIPRTGQLCSLPDLVKLCRRLELPRFKLPNYKIGATSEPVDAAGLLQPEDLEELRGLLSVEPLATAGIALEVHDLFLWELIFPQGGGERSEYGGCQAANSLGHIAPNGDLWPCSSWPVRLGSLLSADVETLWNGKERFRVRDAADQAPPDCKGCSDYQICFGGCRGLALRYRQGDAKRDLLCSGPRK